MRPLTDRVVMRQHEAKVQTQSGLYLPTKEKPNLADVIYIGPAVKDVKVGDTVILGTKWFTNFKHDGEDLLIVNEPDILAVLES